MQPRTLEQILGELSSSYDPQVQALRQRQSLIPQQIESEEKGLKAQQEQSFQDIMGGARRRGLGFSGIPLEEQARYTSTQFLPALARLRQSGQEQALSLEDAILGINERRNTLAQQLRDQEVSRAEQMRQFNEQLAENRRQFDLQQQASARASGGGSRISPTLGGGVPTSRANVGGASAQGVNVPPQLQQLYNQVFVKPDGGMWTDRDLVSDYNATLDSARRGNARDRQKIELYHSSRPDLFGSSIPSLVLSNSSGGGLRF